MAINANLRIASQRPIQVNMTSMVDIVFLLIIFFMLVSQFITAENIPVELPQPQRSLARAIELPERVVLNCQYAGSVTPVRYRLGPIAIVDLRELEERLTAVKRERPDVQVILRADRRVTYKDIRGAMQAVARAGIEHMNIAAEIED